MAIQLSVAVRNARLDAFETTVGTAAVLRIRTGAPRRTALRPMLARYCRSHPAI